MGEAQTRKKGLGRGLGALLPQAQPPAPASQRTYFTVGIEEIRPNPWQPRKKVGAASIEQLADSIRVNGIIQPLVVRKTEEGYELIAGERRWRAAQKAGLREVPVVVKDTTPHLQLELALIENIQRQNLNPIEEAEAYRRLIEEFSLSQEEVARRVGKERSTVANCLRILRLPGPVQEMILEGAISLGQAKCLLSFEDSREQIDLARQIVERQLSVRDLERIIKKTSKGAEKKKVRPVEGAEDWVKELVRSYQTRIQVKTGKRGGRIEIHYRSEEELIRLVDLLLSKPASRL
ncbi:MAG: ParB/RepB/Spo0J family partition protein [Deltaproteobacteria bacterium]|nr:ParB/RepB/Spo0J family partition protein [Deltaproteobacteria bacterium]